MAKYAKTTQWQVRQIWDAADLEPPRLETLETDRTRHWDSGCNRNLVDHLAGAEDSRSAVSDTTPIW